jgi:hypothetical protein
MGIKKKTNMDIKSVDMSIIFRFPQFLIVPLPLSWNFDNPASPFSIAPCVLPVHLTTPNGIDCSALQNYSLPVRESHTV